MEAKGHKIICGTLIEKDGKFLLVQEAQKKAYKKWCFPAGHLDVGETIFEAAVREAREESGCEVELTGLCHTVQIEHSENACAVAFTFTAKLLREGLGYREDEILDVQWFTYEEILAMRDQLRLPVPIIGAIENYRAGISAPLSLFQSEIS